MTAVTSFPLMVKRKEEKESKQMGKKRTPNHSMGLHPWLSGKNLPANAGDAGLIPGCGTSPGEGHGNPFQYSCLENPMDRGAWWAVVHGVMKESDVT